MHLQGITVWERKRRQVPYQPRDALELALALGALRAVTVGSRAGVAGLAHIDTAILRPYSLFLVFLSPV